MLLLYILIIFLTGFLFYNIGEITNKIFNFNIDWTDVTILGIISYFIIVGLFQIFFPVNYLLPSILLIATSTILIKNKDYVIRRIEIKTLMRMSVLVVILIPLLNYGSKNYDHYLYHDQTVAWFNQYKLIRGLANIHGRFGFNNSLFPVSASFQINPLTNLYHINIFLFILFIFKSVNYYKRNKSITTLIGISFLALNIFIYGFDYFNNASPDFQSAIFTTFVFLNFIEYTKNRHPFRYILILATFAITVKLNTAIFLFIIFCVTLFSELQKIKFQKTLKSLIFPIIILAVWCARSIILSGQPIYPFNKLYLNIVPHAVSHQQIVNEQIMVTGFAQRPCEDFGKFYEMHKGTLNWVPHWYTHHLNGQYSRIPLFGSINVSSFAILSFIIGFLFLIILIKNKTYIYTILFFALISNVIFWFITAPDYRFGFITFLLLIVSPLFLQLKKYNYFNLISFLFITIASPYLLFNSSRHYLISLNSLLRNKTKDSGINPNLIKLKFYNKNRTDSFIFYTPTHGDQSPENTFPVLAYPAFDNEIYIMKEGDKLIGFYRYSNFLALPYQHNINEINSK